MADRTPATPRIGPFTWSNVAATPTPAPAATSGTHPVEVVGRIREHPDGRGEPSVIQALPNGKDLRITSKEHQQGYRVFSLDGVSKAEDENLEAFYRRYVEGRVDDVKTGGKCTIMMYGPTGAGKSHTMFGSGTERGVAYHALSQIMGEGSAETGGQEVRATVWEIYNEEIYDLLAQTSNPAGSMKGQMNRVKLEVKGKRVRNSTCRNDCVPMRLLKEIQKVEKRRVTKSTGCNDRSSRSHCVVTFEVPAVDGRLVLVDMAGSENIEQAGIGSENKMQTGKINQGNGALKRVVEAIANGENHIPYRDSKLTMLLQESFEDKNAKVLMILCASPDPKDLYKTLGTFEYGAKAKRIVRLPNSPAREKASEEEQQKLAIVNAKDVAKDACILKLRREKEKSDREREVKEKEVTILRKRVNELESQMSSRKYDSDLQLEVFRKQADQENDVTKQRVEELEFLLQQTNKEADFQRLRADKAEAELNQLKRISFSNLENNLESADWGSMKPHGVKVESPGSKNEKCRPGLSPLALQDSKVNVFGTPTTIASPKEKKERKFSSSVLSFFKGGDSGHSSKKSSHVKAEPKVSDSPRLPSPKTEKKRQAGHETPSPKTAEKRRHTTGQDLAIGAMTWQPSSLQELLKAKEEPVSPTVHSSAVDAHQSWLNSLPSRSTDPNSPCHLPSRSTDPNSPCLTRDLVLPDAPHTSPDGEEMDSSPPERALVSYADESETIQQQIDKDPLGLLTWSEPKLHRKGWLPIIIEEEEDNGEGDKAGRRSSEDPAIRGFASCPRFSDVEQSFKFGFQSTTTVSNEELPSPGFYPSNLLRDKFSPLALNEGADGVGKWLDVGGYVSSSDELSGRIAVKNELLSASPVQRSLSPTDSFLQRLCPPSLHEGDGLPQPSESAAQTQGESPTVTEPASVRKATIENIFLLCGHRREMAARTGADSPLPSVPASPGVGEHRDQVRADLFGDSFSLNDPVQPISSSVPSSPVPGYRERDISSPLPSYRERDIASPLPIQRERDNPSPLSSYRERDSQSHLSLESEGIYSPAQSPFRSFSNLENRLRSPASPEVIGSVPSSPLLPVLPSPQKSDSPSRHRKFRNGNLFQFSKTAGEDGPDGLGVVSPLAVSPAFSARKPAISNGYVNENAAELHAYDPDLLTECDVYVKWEAKDAPGNLICMVKIRKRASLADLRQLILPHVPCARQAFQFCMFGDSGGAPADPKMEPDLSVSSLPESPNGNGSRVAALRPPITYTLYSKPTVPFRPIENTIPSEQIANSAKLTTTKFGPKMGTASGKPVQPSGNNSTSIVKGLRTRLNGVGRRGGSTMREKASTAYFQEIASKFL